jgi:protoporphyrinogen oxidase
MENNAMHELPVVVIGAGPAGLACAEGLVDRGLKVIVVEREERVGGISRSFKIDDFVVDCGNHHLGMGQARIKALVTQLFPQGVPKEIPRVGLVWRGRLFGYPLSFRDLFSGIPMTDILRAVVSFLAAHRPWRVSPRHAEDALSRRYGRYLFEKLFGPYLHKVWGRHASKLSPLIQSGRAMSLWSSLGALPSRSRSKLQVITPPAGQGQFYERWATALADKGVVFRLATSVVAVEHALNEITCVCLRECSADQEETLPCQAVVSTMPLPHLLSALTPGLSSIGSRNGGQARHVLLVFLVQRQSNPFDERCLYVADPGSPLIRLTNFTVQYGNAARNPGRSLLCAEYWLDPGEPQWDATDEALVQTTLGAFAALPFQCDGPVVTHHILRFPYASPVRTTTYETELDELRKNLGILRNLHLLGRAGAFLYADQDVVIEAGGQIAAEIAATSGAME